MSPAAFSELLCISQDKCPLAGKNSGWLAVVVETTSRRAAGTPIKGIMDGKRAPLLAGDLGDKQIISKPFFVT